MKYLLLPLLLISLSCFSQDKPEKLYLWPDGKLSVLNPGPALKDKPDTLRAICMVTLFPNGIARARMGFVVICAGRAPVYLDCRKRALKLPMVGWGWIGVNPNVNQKQWQ